MVLRVARGRFFNLPALTSYRPERSQRERCAQISRNATVRYRLEPQPSADA